MSRVRYSSIAELPPGTYSCTLVRITHRQGGVYATFQLIDGRAFTALVGRRYGSKLYVERVRHEPR